MLDIKFKEETRVEMFFLLGVLLVLFLMLLLNIFLQNRENKTTVKKEKNITVIIREAKKDAESAKPPSKAVVAAVADIIKQSDYSTAYMEINRVPKNSPEYKELSKIIAEEKLKRKAPTIRRDAGTSAGSFIRYLDESTPRDRSTDAVYLYFVDIAGTMFPTFCIQSHQKRPLGIREFIISADKKNITVDAPSVKLEHVEKGVSEWYEAPLDKRTYGAVQAIITAKKVTLTAVGSKGKTSRDLKDEEITGIRRVLDGYTALGGNLNYMSDIALPLSPQKQTTAGSGTSRQGK
jgi:hypothetical protein